MGVGIRNGMKKTARYKIQNTLLCALASQWPPLTMLTLHSERSLERRLLCTIWTVKICKHMYAKDWKSYWSGSENGLVFNSFKSSPLYNCDSWVCDVWNNEGLRLFLLSFMLFRVILTYFHIECQREKEAKSKNQFNEVFIPDKTDVEAILPFMKKGTEVDKFTQGDRTIITVQLSDWQISGPEYILTQFCPCAIVKMVTKVHHTVNGHEDQIKSHQEDHRVTILDARKHKPGIFSETGFTLVTLDEVWLMKYRSQKSRFFFQEPGTKNWRHGSQDIHLFQEMMNPHLMKMYPHTKVACTSYLRLIS